MALQQRKLPQDLPPLQDKFGEIAALISRYERVRINAPMLSHMNIRLSIADNEGDLSQVDSTSTHQRRLVPRPRPDLHQAQRDRQGGHHRLAVQRLGRQVPAL
jgi:hypothetical protein